MICGEIEILDRGGLFGDVVDEAACGGDSALKTGDAFEEFDTLLVFERHILLTGDGHAVDLEAGGEIDGEAADFVVAVVADRSVVFADGGVVFNDVREQARALIEEEIVGDDGG